MTENLAIARRFMEIGIATGNAAAFDECLADDIVVRTGLSPAAPIKGLQAYKDVFLSFAKALPVIDFEILEMWENEAENKVIVRFLATAVFVQDYYGITAEHQIVAMEEVHILTFHEAKIISNIVSGTNIPFEYLMYPVLKDAIVGTLPTASPEQVAQSRQSGQRVG
jgi:hypothetical protein